MRGSIRTAEGGKHQVVDTIYERHVQAQDEADEAVGQKYDRSRKIDPQEFPLAELYLGSKMAASVLGLLWVARCLLVSHTNDWGIRLPHERQ